MEEKQVKGHWLKTALDAQEVTPSIAAKRMDKSGRVDTIYNHLSNKHHMSSESLAKLGKAFPTLNIRFVLTGEGSPLL